MIGSIIISLFVLILVLFIYFTYKNKKKYKEERRQKHQNNRKEEKSTVKKARIEKPTEADAQTHREKNLEEKKSPFMAPEKVTVEQKSKKAPTVEEVIEKPKATTISLGDYPKFDHSRLKDMGLSEEEAIEFVTELIPQIETQIPFIKEAMINTDLDHMERLIHSIKGSSTTVGTGGISDLLVDYDAYLRTGTEPVILEAYFEHLKHYYEELKEQYS